MPRYTWPHDLVPPDPPDMCELAVFPVAVVPYALGALEVRATAYTWSATGYLRGNQLIRSLQMSLLCGGIKEITDRQDNLYRMIDSAIFGRDYSVLQTEPELIVSPAIEPVHALEIENDESILGRLELNKQLLENALNGTDTPNYAEPLGIRELLEQIKVALEAESNLDPEMLAKLAEIALAVA